MIQASYLLEKQPTKQKHIKHQFIGKFILQFMIAVIFVILIKIYLSYLLAQNFTERKYKGWYLQIKLGPTF